MMCMNEFPLILIFHKIDALEILRKVFRTYSFLFYPLKIKGVGVHDD